MRKLLLLLFSLILHQWTFAQCDEIFISEYVHGLFNNRAIEIYNPTANTVNLADYRIVRWSNGNDLLDNQYVEPLSGSIDPGDVFVIVSDKRNPMDTGTIDEPIHKFLEAKADLFLGADYNVNRCFFFNGNDAMSIEKNVGGTWQVIDIIGEPGVDPGQGWTDDASANFTDANGGTWMTRRRVLVRKFNVMEGRTWNFSFVPPNPSPAPSLEDGPMPFNATLGWDTMPRSAVFDSTYTDSLQFHRCACADLTSVGREITLAEITVAPNPATNGALTVSAEGLIKHLVMFNILGQEVFNESYTANSSRRTIGLNDMDNGPYFLKVTLNEGQEAVHKVIINQ